MTMVCHTPELTQEEASYKLAGARFAVHCCKPSTVIVNAIDCQIYLNVGHQGCFELSGMVAKSSGLA